MEQFSRHHHVGLLFIVLLFGRQHCQESKVSFSPINLEIFNDSNNQRLYVEWNVTGDTSGLDSRFHVEVSRTAETNVIWNETYISNSSKDTFRLSWDSDAPLECYTHFVRIRAGAKEDQEWSPWTQWKTHHGNENMVREKPQVYPHEKTVQEGSSVHFCCIPGRNQTVKQMQYSGKMYSAPPASDGTFEIVAEKVKLTKRGGANIYCKTNKKIHGTVLFVTNPPDEPKNLSCETRDLKMLICTWLPGKESNMDKDRAPRYTLYEQFSQNSKLCTRNNCTWPINKNQQIFNFTLTAENQLGKKSVGVVVNATQRVHLLDPTDFEFYNLNARNVTLKWKLKANYTGLNLYCQTELHKDNQPIQKRNVTLNGKNTESSYAVSLTQLKPYSNYNIRVRCVAVSPVPIWSNWSKQLKLRTHEDVPAAELDVWREVSGAHDSRTVTLYWKPLPEHHANGNILSYNVTWKQLNGQNKYQSKLVPALENSTQVPIEHWAYIIQICVQNAVGRSPPAEIRIPKANINDSDIKEERVNGTHGGIYLSWEEPPAGHYNGFIIDWCNFPKSLNCELQWKKLNSSVHNDVIQSSAFIPGVKYHFRVYGSSEDGEHLLERKAGYMQELACAVTLTMKTEAIKADSVLLTWDSYLRDVCQEGFITDYKIYIKSLKGICGMKNSQENNLTDGTAVCTISIGDSIRQSIAIHPLAPDTKYEIALVATTGGGESPLEFMKIHTQPDTSGVIFAIILPVIIFSVLALILLIVGYWKWHWIKKLCYPDIPDPNKSNILSFPTYKDNKEKVMVPGSCVTQKIEIVYNQELAKPYLNEELKMEGERCQFPSGLTEYCNTGDSLNNTQCIYQSLDDMFDPIPMTSYLEFFNKNYRSTSDEALETLTYKGYKPQTEMLSTKE
ncbi:hypothetical protein GDO86_002467 [Hymenochirus boettgeri]|uniref:Fibronectin type-III domain-containing protein n=1 Tax=Hymenochirus boettgeri TaxID=247094 RepID=A0A8T2KMN9_9PIPI|nr:hypothetical protein GDO86_002467 [Hymenochirus boettgeri]